MFGSPSSANCDMLWFWFESLHEEENGVGNSKLCLPAPASHLQGIGCYWCCETVHYQSFVSFLLALVAGGVQVVKEMVLQLIPWWFVASVEVG